MDARCLASLHRATLETHVVVLTKKVQVLDITLNHRLDVSRVLELALNVVWNQGLERWTFVLLLGAESRVHIILSTC